MPYTMCEFDFSSMSINQYKMLKQKSYNIYTRKNTITGQVINQKLVQYI